MWILFCFLHCLVVICIFLHRPCSLLWWLTCEVLVLRNWLLWNILRDVWVILRLMMLLRLNGVMVHDVMIFTIISVGKLLFLFTCMFLSLVFFSVLLFVRRERVSSRRLFSFFQAPKDSACLEFAIFFSFLPFLIELSKACKQLNEISALLEINSMLFAYLWASSFFLIDLCEHWKNEIFNCEFMFFFVSSS